MTDQQVLEKAIQKAIEGGWKRQYTVRVRAVPATEEEPKITYKTTVDDWDTYAPIIFDHKFAKSFFGTQEVCFNCGLEGKHDPYCAERTSYDEAWKYHLREMVVYDNPIEYLEEHLDD